MQGFFITFEGIEGSGKTTQARALYEFLQQQQIPSILLKEPGGTLIGDRIRELLLDPAHSEMTSITEVLLYAASRAQLVSQVICPHLEEGYVVISDRFLDSSIAYQAFGREIPLNIVREINSPATWGLEPDLTFYLELQPEESRMRVKLRMEEMEELPDRMDLEKLAFFKRVMDGYTNLIGEQPARFRCLDAKLPPQELHKKIVELMEKEFKKRKLYTNAQFAPFLLPPTV